MKISSVNVFDSDLVPPRGKGKKNGGDDLVKSPGKVKAPVRAPRPDKQNHQLEEGKKKILMAHLARITSAAANIQQDPMESDDDKFRDQSIAGLDHWLSEQAQGREDMLDMADQTYDAPEINTSRLMPYDADLSRDDYDADLERHRQDHIDEFGDTNMQNPYRP